MNIIERGRGMKPMTLYLLVLLCVLGLDSVKQQVLTEDNLRKDDGSSLLSEDRGSQDTAAYFRKIPVTPMEALDAVKELYAANFVKIAAEGEKDYYYKLPNADYYLYYEGLNKPGGDYLIHLYEFVLDEPETGIGHTVTYGWFTVDKMTGEITDNTQ